MGKFIVIIRPLALFQQITLLIRLCLQLNNYLIVGIHGIVNFPSR